MHIAMMCVTFLDFLMYCQVYRLPRQIMLLPN